jgi:hypothetical protein
MGGTSNTRTRTNRALTGVLLIVLTLLAAGSLAGNASALTKSDSASTAPWIQSDQADYAPGATVTLTGGNWQPGESVHIFVNDDIGQSWSRNVDVIADADGAIRDQFQLPASFASDYNVTATGATSGTARTAFTDGNVKFDVAPTGTTAQFVETIYAAATNCTGATKSGFPKTLNGSNGDNVGVGGNESIRIDAAATSDQGGTFSAWSTTDGSPFTVIAATGGKSICIAGFQSGTRNYRATYNAPNQNSAPAIAANNTTVTVNEGATAANTGTWSDANAGDTVTLSASVGTVTKSGTNASGTWSWSFATTDGPTQSQMVTITANDGNGGVTSTNFSLTVNNVTPVVTAPANQNATQGVSTAFNLGSFTDPGADSPWAITVNWGDGSTNTTFNATAVGTITGQSHTYANPGPFTVNVSVKDKDNATGSASFTVTVAAVNHAPTAIAGGPYSGDEGSPIQLDGSGSSDPDAGDTLTYAWSAGAAPCSFSSATAQKPTITCTDNGSFSVSLTVTDNHGAASAASNAALNVANVAPSATFSTTGPVNEGQSFQLSLTGTTDPSSADTSAGFQFAFDCGDGSGYGAFGAANTRTCSTTDDGNRSVKGKVKDKDGGVSEYTSSVAVNNVAPTIVSVVNNGPINEGGSATITVTATDPAGAADPLSYEFDCNNDGIYEVGPQAGNSHACSFANNGSKQVNVRVSDGDGGSATGSTTVAVNNVAPTISSVTNDGPVNEGDSATITVAASDPADTLSYEFDCNNDSTYEVGPQAGNTHACSFNDNGARQVNVRVSDGDGGSTTGSTTVTVHNVAPAATFSNDGPVNEGASFHLSLTSPSDPSSADTAAGFQYAFDCGSGSGYGAFGASDTATCATADDATRSVKGQIKDKDGGVSEYDATVIVNNVDPSLSGQTDQAADEGASKSFDLGSFSDPGADSPWKLHVDWGDSSSSDPSDRASTGSLGNASHTYADDGEYTVTITVTDKDGGVGSATFKATVANKPPTATLGNNGPVVEGSPATISFTGQSDPSSADTAAGFHYAYACDNGSLATATYAGSGASASDSCTYADNGSYTVRARIIDKDGGFSEYTTVVSLTNAKPVLTKPTDDTGVEGTSKSFGLGSFSDAGTNDNPWQLHVSWGDGSPDTNVPYGAQGALGMAPHAYADNGSYTVTETITDKDGGSDTQTFKVEIANVDPTVTAGSDDAANEGSSKSYALGSFDDPGTNDHLWAVDIDWGDGTAHGSANKSATGSLGSVSHTYDDNGNYTVTVKVTDKDGGSGQDTFEVSVANVAPTAALGNNGPVDEGSPATISFSGQHDPSGADTAAGFHYSYACNGDTSALATTYAEATDGASKQCTFADDGSPSVKGRIFDKDGGSTDYATTVQVNNVKPDVSPAADQNSDEGSSHSFALGSFSDPGPDSPWAVDIDWGDGSLHGSDSETSAGSLGSASHTYDDNGNYTVTVKVTDKDGGVGQATFKVAVANVAPTASLANDGPVDEGSPATITFSGQHDPSGADTAAGFHYSYACDGVAGSLATTYAGATDGASKQCTYADNGSYLVKGRIFDKNGGSNTYDTTVVVNNVNPSLTPPSDDNGVEGTSKSFGLGSFADPGANDNPWHLHVTWGDGSAAYDHDYPSRGALGMAPHGYDDNGVYTVTESITDKDGGSDSQTFKVTISNVAPTASLGNNGPVDEGSPATVSFSAQHDASSADTAAGFHYAYSCSNGSLAGATYAGSGTSASTTCTYSDNGSYTVRARIIDKDDGAMEDTTSMIVNNVKPSVTAPADQTASEGTSKSFDLGSFSDPGPDSPWAIDVNWGDGSSHTTDSKTATGSLGNASHTYADNVGSPFTVTVKVTDKDGGYGSATFKVTVGNLPPHITSFIGTNDGLSGPLVFVPNTFTTAFTDPGLIDNPWIASYTWDGVADPSSNQSVGANGTNTHATTQTHAFTAAGCARTAVVKITDKDGLFDTASITVRVGTGGFLPPMTNQPVTNKLRNGQVLPVKIQITDCAGAGVNNLSPAIRLVEGDQTAVPDDSAVAITPPSVSNADTNGVMRSSGSDGSYIYNMSVNLAKMNTDYTVVIYPYGNGAATGPTLRHVIQATK